MCLCERPYLTCKVNLDWGPQGSILGLLSFTIIIYELSKGMHVGSVIYADDTTLLFAHESMSEL